MTKTLCFMHAANEIKGTGPFGKASSAKDRRGLKRGARKLKSMYLVGGAGALSLLGTCSWNPLSFKLLAERIDCRLSVFMVASCMFACHRFEYVDP